PYRQRSYTVPRTSSNVVANRNARMRASSERNLSRNQEFRARNNVAVNRERNVAANRTRNSDVRTRNSVAVNRERNLAANRTKNVEVNRNRNMNEIRASNSAVDNRNMIVFVNNGWYYWNAGYWFPAWGYATDAYYPYDGPIYGYNGLAPDQVVVDVQEQLQRDGYYDGPIDGVLGPMTREAIAAFQADNG